MHDHRKLGRELELFDTDPMIGAGLPYWLGTGAAGLLEQVLAEAGVPYEAEEGEAAFYGPKIDVQVAGSAEREAVARPESGSLGARIRAHRLVPYQAVIGSREAASGQAALRLRDGRQLPAKPAGEVLAGIGEAVAALTR